MHSPTPRPPAPDGVRFYGGPFSNFVGGPIRVNAAAGAYADGILALAGIYGRAVVCASTVEHYFQALKATRPEHFMYVLLAADPVEAKRRGNEILIRFDWERIRERVMHDAVKAKFTQYSLFRGALMDTDDRLIYEDSPTDATWGLWNPAEHAWTGENLLGKTLMQVREELRAAAREPEEVAA